MVYVVIIFAMVYVVIIFAMATALANIKITWLLTQFYRTDIDVCNFQVFTTYNLCFVHAQCDII